MDTESVEMPFQSSRYGAVSRLGSLDRCGCQRAPTWSLLIRGDVLTTRNRRIRVVIVSDLASEAARPIPFDTRVNEMYWILVGPVANSRTAIAPP